MEYRKFFNLRRRQSSIVDSYFVNYSIKGVP